MEQKKMWGEAPTTQQGQKRDVPYVQFNNSDICLFVPMESVTYNLSVAMTDGWEQPVEMWTHDVKNNGQWLANLFCKNITMSNKVCPFDIANLRQAQQQGRSLENKERLFPLAKKFVMAVIVDEVPEKPFMLFKVSQSRMEEMRNQFKLAGRADIKLKLLRTGTGLSTKYSISHSTEPINAKAVAAANIPAITAESYKAFLTGLEDFSKLDFINIGELTGAHVDVGASRAQHEHYQPSPEEQRPAAQGKYQSQQPPTSIPTGDLAKAQAYVIDFGPYAGKKLGELEDKVLQIVANNMAGDVQAHAKLILASRGV